MKKTITAFSIFALALVAFPAEAIAPDFAIGTLPNGYTLDLPGATGNSQVISLGEAIDPESGKLVEGFAILHPKNNEAGKSNNVRGGKPGSTTNSCYAFLTSGVKWKSAEDYMVDPTNNANLDTSTLGDLLDLAVNTWDTQVTTEIFGSQTNEIVDGVDKVSPDGKNEVLFGPISSPGAIAVTTVWGVFSGNPSWRELVEWDMQFDDADFSWNTNGNSDDMDFLNIAVHEVGHAAGMGHPDITCALETMHRYATKGEIIKRDLHDGDIAGIKALY